MSTFDELIKSPICRPLSTDSDHVYLRLLKGEHIFDIDSLLFPEPDMTELETEEQIACLKFAQLAMVGEYAFSTWLDLIEAFKLCESPIEQYFLAAMIYIVKDNQMEVVVEGESVHLDWKGPCGACFHIFPQKQIGEYRVDFLLSMYEPRIVQRKKQEPVESTNVEKTKLVVECDGHDFHEKTKKQATRDKERDRNLQACGFPIYRYSGSDIYRNALGCARECMDYLMGIIRKQARKR